MFTLYDKRNELYQWDINRKVIIDDTTIDEVHFCNKTDNCSLKVIPYEYNNLFVADIPNILLQESFPIKVYAYLSDGYTIVEECLKVKARTKPSDYRYEETTVIKLDDLINRADNAIQQAQQSAQEAGQSATSAGQSATSAEQSASDADKTATDLYDYVDSHILQLTDDNEGNVRLQAIILEGDVPNINDYYTKAQTNAAIEEAVNGIEIPEPDLTPYATQQFVLDKVADIDIPEVPTNISAFNNDAGYLTEHQSLEGYAKTTDIPDVSKYQTADQVTALINDALGVIENGSY